MIDSIRKHESTEPENVENPTIAVFELELQSVGVESYLRLENRRPERTV